MNVLNAIGNINNSELRFLPDSTPILQFSFALNSGYGQKQTTTWLNCSLFGKRAQTLADMVKKGDKVGISGELTNRKYTDKSGVEKYSLECRINDLTLLGKKDESSYNKDEINERQRSKVDTSMPMEDIDSDFPF